MISDYIYDLYSSTRKAEEDILKQITFKLTGHEATREDAKDFTKMYADGELLNYDLAYKGCKIGRVVFVIGLQSSVTFHPTLPEQAPQSPQE